MPTTFTGLLLFVVLLLPGFAYLVGKERVGTERRLSPFRETVSIVAASVISEMFVALVPGIVLLWLGVFDRPSDHYRLLVTCGVVVVVIATALAYLWSVPDVRDAVAAIPGKISEAEPSWLKLRWLDRFVDTQYPHPSTVSSWWMLFERFREDSTVQVGCLLDDGSYVSGELSSFNPSADEVPDRELVLARGDGVPLLYRPSPHSPAQNFPAGAVCVSARHIVAMFVSYLDPTIPAGATSGMGAGSAGEALAGREALGSADQAEGKPLPASVESEGGAAPSAPRTRAAAPAPPPAA